MDKRNIVIGPKSPLKRDLAKTFRREMTSAEAVLWERLRRNQCAGMHFRRQQVIDGFIADFYCHASGLVVEVDGGVHEVQKEYDRVRDDTIAARGLEILRFTNDRVLQELDAVLVEIAGRAR